MKCLRKVIKEELEKIFSESVFYDEPEAGVFETNPVPLSKDDIINNYELGRMFANNNLQVDIDNLNEYVLSEYLPSSTDKESWSFYFDSVIGNTLIVDIVRVIRGGKSFWTMFFGIKEKGWNELPETKGILEDVEGYNNFIQAVNLRLAKDIDPSKN